MRLWSIHPKYLDPTGLVALWRESLLAKKVLQGKTKGYTNHPQLLRFKRQKDPVAAINNYLMHVWSEAQKRGYSFDASKFRKTKTAEIKVTKGQLLYELKHLNRKLKERSVKFYKQIRNIEEPEPHPSFRMIKGKIEDWEKKK